MTNGNDLSDLSHIDTLWQMVRQAHPPGVVKGTPGDDETATARRALLERYSGAARRYLQAALRDRAAAEELSQDFAVKFMGGAFANVDPGKGRFRDFLKQSLYHLMMDHHRRRKSAPQGLVGDVPAAGPETPWAQAHDEAFQTSWRLELMARAWSSLKQIKGDSGQRYHTILRTRVEDPDASYAELATRLSLLLNDVYDANRARVDVHRARDLFVRMLVREVRETLADCSNAALEEELAELGLLERCRPVMDRRRNAC
ncbi:RNA polymerase sigma factor [Paludisphaera rhizosphaerae]|uniref:RNA polymerase sigma factor n=1 Tax=Paludisphaera rhizosphaerae TaxID=2711216 RepID=UPI0013EB3A64|nr:sigma-70 family RNA polymerase sigma factor [Paludisphaera rhizosphaerae]